MADSFNKKEREKKRQKRKRDKEQKREQRKLEGKKQEEFMYVDENGHLTSVAPDRSQKGKINIEDIEISTPKKGKSDQSNFIRTGVVKFFNTEKGYGFIVDKETKESFFVHAESLIDKIGDNDAVSFEVGSGPKGPVAVSVKLS